ncbi:hypothetical protein BC829DRAFT_264376 [Chytridium lagenaria]|nr:hypothetical protein BC829DRAFT_264376 [Chytridium lagenaria]
MPVLTAGEECQMAARSLSAFTGTGAPGTGIPKNFITMAMAIAIVRGGAGVAVVRLKTGEWSAPCAIMLENPAGDIKTEQDTVLLFMSENSVLSLVARTRMILGSTHRFACGGLVGNPIIDGSNDVYVYVRFNNTFTPANLVLSAMTGWGVREDMDRHSRWHGADVTWADVLMNKITVDRSSIGNALYLVINIAAGGSSTGVFEMNGRKNFANLEKLPVRKGLDQQGGAASPTQTATSSPRSLQHPASRTNDPSIHPTDADHPSTLSSTSTNASSTGSVYLPTPHASADATDPAVADVSGQAQQVQQQQVTFILFHKLY